MGTTAFLLSTPIPFFKRAHRNSFRKHTISSWYQRVVQGLLPSPLSNNLPYHPTPTTSYTPSGASSNKPKSKAMPTTRSGRSTTRGTGRSARGRSQDTSDVGDLAKTTLNTREDAQMFLEQLAAGTGDFAQDEVTPSAVGMPTRASRVVAQLHTTMGTTLAMEIPKLATTKVPQYNGNDWSLWSLKFEMWAKVNALWPYIQEVVPMPPEVSWSTRSTPQQRQAVRDKRELYTFVMDKAYESLLTAMEKPDHQRLVAEFKGRGGEPPRVHQAWMRLKAAHTVLQQTSYLRISKEMAELKLRPQEAIAQYWARAQELREKCREVDVPVTTKSFLSAVLTGLPKSWGPLVMFESRMLDTMTEDNLLVSLLEEEDRQKDTNEGADVIALYGAREPFKGKNGWRKNNSKHNNATPNHLRPQGGDFKSEWGTLGPAPQGMCEGCHKRGHKWMDCWSRPEGAVPRHLKRVQEQQAQGGYNDSPPAVLLASVKAASASTKGNTNSMWLIDSGASCNFTPHLSDFHGPMGESKAKHVNVGDGTKLSIKGMGQMLVQGKNGHEIVLTKVLYVPAMQSRLLSVAHLTSCGAQVSFTETGCRVLKGGKTLMEGIQMGEDYVGLFKVELTPVGSPNHEANLASVCMKLVHKTWSHAPKPTMQTL